MYVSPNCVLYSHPKIGRYIAQQHALRKLSSWHTVAPTGVARDSSRALEVYCLRLECQLPDTRHASRFFPSQHQRTYITYIKFPPAYIYILALCDDDIRSPLTFISCFLWPVYFQFRRKSLAQILVVLIVLIFSILILVVCSVASTSASYFLQQRPTCNTIAWRHYGIAPFPCFFVFFVLFFSRFREKNENVHLSFQPKFRARCGCYIHTSKYIDMCILCQYIKSHLVDKSQCDCSTPLRCCVWNSPS